MSADFDELVGYLQDKCDEASVKRFGQAMVDRWKAPSFVGEMPSPSAFARTKGSCGDDIAIYLKIKDGVVEKASFYANGCGTGVVCGDAACQLAQGRTLVQVLAVTGQDVIETIGGLPADKRQTAHATAAALIEAVKGYLEKA